MSKEMNEIIGLCGEFNVRADVYIAADPDLQQKFEQAMPPFAAEYREAYARILAIAEDSPSPEQLAVNEEFQNANLKIMEIIAQILSDILTEEQISAALPEGLKNQTAADLLRSRGAENMAKLCK